MFNRSETPPYTLSHCPLEALRGKSNILVLFRVILYLSPFLSLSFSFPHTQEFRTRASQGKPYLHTRPILRVCLCVRLLCLGVKLTKSLFYFADDYNYLNAIYIYIVYIYMSILILIARCKAPVIPRLLECIVYFSRPSCMCPTLGRMISGPVCRTLPAVYCLRPLLLPRTLSSQVLIAACDTFRSGAVEQLRVHCRCLDVPLFEKGCTDFLVLLHVS